LSVHTIVNIIQKTPNRKFLQYAPSRVRKVTVKIKFKGLDNRPLN
jgi:GTP cyclohydrolase I